MSSSIASNPIALSAVKGRTSAAVLPEVLPIQWLVIFKKHQQLEVYPLDLSSSHTGTTAMNELRKKYNSVKPSQHWWHAQATIEEAIVPQYCLIEVPDYPRPILVISSTPRPDLTEAFHNPNLLRGAAKFVQCDEQFNMAPGLEITRRAILITHKVNKHVLMWVVGAVVLIAVLIGILVGYLAHSSTIGISVGFGVVAVLAFIQAFLLKMYN